VDQVGGIKEKVLAARRAGITRVILPKRNEKDLHEVPADVQVCLVPPGLTCIALIAVRPVSGVMNVVNSCVQ